MAHQVSNGGEALVVCSDKSMGIGITVWDIATGDRLLHIASCASPPRALVCLRNQFVVASQIHRHGSVGGGAISMWALNKPQQPLWSYPLEVIVSLACTKSTGAYLAGGAPSGNAYLWEVTGGKLLKTWRAHHSSVSCIMFYDDGSLLISGSEDGVICVWSLVSLLDVEDCESFPSLLNYSTDHKSSITGLSATSGSSRLILVSSSLDGSCKVWDVSLGKHIRTHVYAVAITALVLNPTEQLFLSGGKDGRIFVNKLEIELLDDLVLSAENQAVTLKGHNGSITALTFCQSGLISASEDCTICIWDVTSWTIIHKFEHQKGAVTNLAVIPKSTLVPGPNNRQGFGVSKLHKNPQPSNSSSGDIKITLAPSWPCQYLKENSNQTSDSHQQIYGMEKECSAASMEMKLEKCLEQRMWATRMTKHVMDMNRHMQSRLLDLMQSRSTEMESPPTKKRKTLMLETPPLQDQEKQP